MINYDTIIMAQKYLVDNWGEDGKNVIATAARENPYNKSFDAFLNSCTACGGNWGGMLLTGLKRLYPAVWDCVPEQMGHNAWGCICSTLVLCGIDTSG